jgi:hypothetical protein
VVCLRSGLRPSLRHTTRTVPQLSHEHWYKNWGGVRGEAVFVVEPEVELRESVGFNVRELSRAEDLIHDHLELIKQKWTEHLG